MYTFEEVLAFVGWILAGAVVLRNGGKAIADIIQAFRAPNAAQDLRIEALEKDMKHVKSCLDNDNKRFKQLEDGNRVTALSLLALLDHGLDGNNISQMENAKKELNQYLVNK